MVYCVGLTGNLASGKSTAAQFFKTFGVELIDADQIARQITTQDQPAYHQIIAHFGPSVVCETGQLNRRHLRELIFANEHERKWLEALLHPLIRQAIEQHIPQCQSPYCLIDIPLLTDKTAYPYLNTILLITAPISQQVARVMARDHCTERQALTILASQPTLSLRLKCADDVINNDSNLDALKQSIRTLHEKYLQDALTQSSGF